MPYFPNFRFILILQFIILTVSIFGQTLTIGEEEFVIKPFSENITSTTDGSFILNQNDFILCKGQNFTGNPPVSKGSFEFSEKKITNLGEFNNQMISALEEGKLNLAIEMGEAGIKFDPLFIPILYNLARIYSIQLDFKESEKYFLKASRLLPDYYRVWMHLGLVQDRLSKFQPSVYHLQKAASLNEFTDEARLYLCEIYSKKEHPHSYNKLPKLSYPEKPGINQSICAAMLEYHKEQYGKAYWILKKANIADKPEPFSYSPKYHLILAESAFKNLDMKTAFDEWEKFLRFKFHPSFWDSSEYTIRRKQKMAKDVLDKSKL
jgi:tetratricopeptide (TPR) repeat protein